MPVEDPDIAAIVTTAAFGAGAGGLIAMSKPMTRREVVFNVFGATLLAATIPQVVVHYTGLHPMTGWLLGVACGLSVPFLVNLIQKATEKYITKKTNGVMGGDKP